MAGANYDGLWEAAWTQAASQGPGFRSRYEILLRLMSRHGVSGRLLEVGAGIGAFLEKLHRRFPWLELSAHEGSEAALERLRQLDFLDTVYGGPLEADGTLGHAGFHSIVCSEVLEHVEDHEGALDNLIAILRPGGRLYLTVPLHQKLWNQVDDRVGHCRRYQRNELADLCRGRGLEVEANISVGFPFYNAYYRVLGRRSPEETAQAAAKSPALRLASRALAAVFVGESYLNTPWGGRGAVVARKPIAQGARGN